MRIGPKWTYGFLQVIPDAEPPETKLRNNSLKDFLIPEQHLSLKLYFDNLRNYAICAALMALGAWVWSYSVQKLPFQVPDWLPNATAISVWSYAGVFLLMNCAQTWLLARELYLARRQISIARISIYRGEHFLHYVLGIFHMAISMVVDMLGRLMALLLSAALIAISIGFVAYTVLSRHGAG